MSPPTVTSAPECTSCGSCCFSDDPKWIAVFSADEKRMSAATLELTRLDGDRRFMRFENGHCLALVFDGQAQTALCRIHPERPDACRWLERGSAECLRQVATKRELVQLRILSA